MSKTSKARSKYSKYIDNLKTIALVLLIAFGIAPVVLAAIPGTSSNVSFSIYNESDDGLSFVREQIEAIPSDTSTQSKYNVSNIVSNLNILNRFNGSGTLVIVGPSSDFGVTETISVILYMLRGGSVIIADDFGSGNQVLKPIFDAFQNFDDFSAKAQAQGYEIPSFSDIFSGDTETSEEEGSGGSIEDQLPDNGNFGGSASDINQEDFMINLIGEVIKEFGFNTSGILMDINSNSGHPARPVIKDFYSEEIPGYTFTQGLNKVATEFGSIISVKLNVTARDEFGDPITDANGNTVYKEVWQPLQKLSTSLLGDELGGGSGEGIPLPFFPMYSTRGSWIETDFESAAQGTMEPDLNEWGNANFATALSLPMFPGFGKLIFVADPSIFINRYTENTAEYDNMQLVQNLIEMATFGQEPTAEFPKIPVLFDFGHTYQGLTSPALYSTALLKLIAEISMFPLYAPFVPFFAYGYGKRLIPGNRRLRPILLTKRRGERGHSDFERKLELIKETKTFGEPIMFMAKRLIRKIRSDVRWDGVTPKNPREAARFFKENFPQNIGSERELRSQIASVYRIAENPTRRMGKLAARKYLDLLKKLDELLG